MGHKLRLEATFRGTFQLCRTNCQTLMPLPLICLTLPLTCGRFVLLYDFIENKKTWVFKQTVFNLRFVETGLIEPKFLAFKVQ